eukprot:7946687-Pyramimonas_sp.AAC.1
MSLKVPEALGAEHIRESHIVSKCHEILGAERSGASRRFPYRPDTFGAEYIREPHMVSQRHKTLSAERNRSSSRL